jgi:hypothetical protein
VAGRRTNLALLALLVLAFVTGVASWAVGSALVRWNVIAHGIVGLSILALAPWKSTIARRGLQRRRPGRGTAIAFAVLIVTSVVAALVQQFHVALHPRYFNHNALYHVIRASVEVVDSTHHSVKIYYDENPTPAIDEPNLPTPLPGVAFTMVTVESWSLTTSCGELNCIVGMALLFTLTHMR